MAKLKVSKLETIDGKEATLLRCPNGRPHDLVYQGQETQGYRCRECFSRITKEQLKEMTDA